MESNTINNEVNEFNEFYELLIQLEEEAGSITISQYIENNMA